MGGNPQEVVTVDQCALVEEHKDEGVTKKFEQNTLVVTAVQTPKVAPEAEPATGEEGAEMKAPHPAKEPIDLEEGKKGDHLGDETKEENGKEETAKVDEITEKFYGASIKKDEEAGKEHDAAEVKLDTDEKNGEEEVKATATADGNEGKETEK